MSKELKANSPETVRSAGEKNALPDMNIKLESPISFDGVEIKEINMRGLLDMTLYDKDAVDREMKEQCPHWDGEITERYAAMIAARINGKPWEWLNALKVRDAIRLRFMVNTFFFIRL